MRTNHQIFLNLFLMTMIFVISVLLFGCQKKQEIKLNNYRLEDVSEDQVVFTYGYANFGGGGEYYMWIVNKEGKCKKIDMLLKENCIREDCDETEYLAKLDAWMADDTIPFMEQTLDLNKEDIRYCINLQDIELETVDEGTICDAPGISWNLVSGVKQKRQLKEMETFGANGNYACDNETIQKMCAVLRSVQDFEEPEKKEVFNDYRLEDVRENQVMFAYHYDYDNPRNDDHLSARYVWIINKKGKCKRIDLNENPNVYSKNDKKFLANLDRCMADEKIPFDKLKIKIPEEDIRYCINLEGMKLKASSGTVIYVSDKPTKIYYMVSGIKKKRRLTVMEELGGNGDFYGDNYRINEVSYTIYSAFESQ